MISGKARLAGVIGWPVGHSLSPRLHNHWMAKAAVDGAYVPLAVQPDDLEAVVRGLTRAGFLGFNVTLPHKERMFALVDECDPAARRMRAVNTVLVDADGQMTGYNTDGYGFIANLDTSLENAGLSWKADSVTAVVIGTGGAARAIICALIDRGIERLRLVNRTLERAERLAEEVRGWGTVPLEIHPWKERHAALAGAGLCINCTSLGMQSQPPLDLALDELPQAAIVADIVYIPLVTGLLEKARSRGHPVVDGLGMLIHQAVPGFCHWGGTEPVIDEEVRALMLAG